MSYDRSTRFSWDSSEAIAIFIGYTLGAVLLFITVLILIWCVVDLFYGTVRLLGLEKYVPYSKKFFSMKDKKAKEREKRGEPAVWWPNGTRTLIDPPEWKKQY